jgi:hypothetical protein
MPRVATGGTVTLRANIARSNGFPADAPDLTLDLVIPSGGSVAGFPVAIPPIVRDDLGLYHYVWTVPADLPTSEDLGGDDYTATWAGTVDSAPADGSESIEIVEPGEIAVSFVSIAEVRALIKSRLSDSDLQDVIDREEAWLAGKVGTLTGERTETYRPSPGDQPVYLQRRAESVVVTDDGVTLVADTDYLFTPSTGMIRRVSWVEPVPPWRQQPLAWRGVVTVTSTPSDGAAVERAIIELIRGTVGETGLDSETIGDYSYTRGASAGRVSRTALWRSILLRRPAYSLRIHSAMESS